MVWGLEKVWDAVVAGQVERMWVERDYWLPGKLADGGKRLLLLDAKGSHGVVPDIVDRVIERAALAGAHVEMVERLGEAEGHHIAAQLGHPLGQDEERCTGRSLGASSSDQRVSKLQHSGGPRQAVARVGGSVTSHPVIVRTTLPTAATCQQPAKIALRK